MTLIASIQRHDAIMTLSDLMISSPSSSARDRIISPFTRQDMFQSGQRSSLNRADFQPSGFAQKCVLFGDNSLALWAGSEYVARSVLKELAAAQQAGRPYETIEDVIHRIGLSKSQIDSISLILFRYVSEYLVQDVLNVQRTSEVAADIVYAGSGSFPVIHDLVGNDLLDNYDHFMIAVFNRLAVAINGEILTGDNEAFNFGGWFELTEVSSGRFSKIPYAVKLWYIDGDRVVDGPAFLSGYNKHNLLLFTLDRREKSAPKPLVVPDFLRREEVGTSEPYIPDKPHDFEFHLVYLET